MTDKIIRQWRNGTSRDLPSLSLRSETFFIGRPIWISSPLQHHSPVRNAKAEGSMTRPILTILKNTGSAALFVIVVGILCIGISKAFG